VSYFMGIDIGSSTSKGVITSDRTAHAHHLLPSGVNYRVAARTLADELLAKGGLSQEDIACTVATGQVLCPWHNQHLPVGADGY
jgi:activator of 2-hydroxyglutaryl-CoA dehydratase